MIKEDRVREYDIYKIRKDFPILSTKVNGKPLVYLDNAATTQRPRAVIEAIKHYQEESHGNPHRGAHYLSIAATKAYEDAREKVREFLNASSSSEIIFTRNATEALNVIANTYGLQNLHAGDEILLSITAHHSNILPWQFVAKLKGAVLKYMYVDEEGRIPEGEIEQKITAKTKVVSIDHMSNGLGTIHPLEKIIRMAHGVGAVVVVDGAQSIPHMSIDVKTIDADFFVFSGHKMLAPMGIGVLYGKKEILLKMPPFLRGGDMIEYVWEQDATFAELPYKFEAGTQNVEGAVGLAAAIDYISQIGIEKIHQHEQRLTSYALSKLLKMPFVTIYGPKDTIERGSVISFTINDIHPHDVASIADVYGVALRAGHHCAQPLMRYLQVPATARASFYFYNTLEEIDLFIESILNVRKWFGYGS